MSRESDRAPRGQVGVHGSCFGSLVCKLQWFLTTKSRKSVDKGISTYYYLHLQTSATEEPGLEEPPLNVGDVARFLCSVITALCSGKGLNLRAHLSWRQSPGTWQLVFWDYQFYLLLMLQTRVAERDRGSTYVRSSHQLNITLSVEMDAFTKICTISLANYKIN